MTPAAHPSPGCGPAPASGTDRAHPVVLFPNWSPERRSEHVVGPKSQVPIGSQRMIWETAPKPSQFPRQIPEAHMSPLPSLPSARSIRVTKRSLSGDLARARTAGCCVEGDRAHRTKPAEGCWGSAGFARARARWHSNVAPEYVNVFCKSGCKSAQTLPHESSPSVAGDNSVECTLDEDIHIANNKPHHSFIRTNSSSSLRATISLSLSLSLCVTLCVRANAQTPAIAPSHYGRYIPLPGDCDGTGVVGPEP